jgi:putative acetyltransferase
MSSPVTIRRQQDGDEQSVRDVLSRAFNRPVVADLAEALRHARPANAELAFVAERGGEVVGQVQLSMSWLDAPSRLGEVLVLSPLGVRPGHQRQGIGRQLVEHAIQEATAGGFPLVFLEGDPAYYSRLGFEPGGRHGFTSPSVRIPEVAFQVKILPSYQEWMTGALVYAEPFWAFDCVGLRS